MKLKFFCLKRFFSTAALLEKLDLLALLAEDGEAIFCNNDFINLYFHIYFNVLINILYILK